MDQKDMSGVLFRNDKGGNDKRPDYTGTATVDGKNLRVAAWIKDGRKGKYMSLSFSEAQQPQRQEQQSGPVGPALDDEILF